MYEYEGVRRLVYGEDRALFIPVCPICSCFVKADPEISFVATGVSEAGLSLEPVTPNATCKRHGRVGMIWEGYE